MPPLKKIKMIKDRVVKTQAAIEGLKSLILEGIEVKANLVELERAFEDVSNWTVQIELLESYVGLVDSVIV